MQSHDHWAGGQKVVPNLGCTYPFPWICLHRYDSRTGRCFSGTREVAARAAEIGRAQESRFKSELHLETLAWRWWGMAGDTLWGNKLESNKEQQAPEKLRGREGSAYSGLQAS